MPRTKIFTSSLKNRFDIAEESINLNTYPYKYSNLKSREKKVQRKMNTSKASGILSSVRTCMMGVPEGEERKKQRRVSKETLAKDFTNLKKDMISTP